MKKWLIALCCIVLAGAVAFVTVVNNKQGQIDTLNKNLNDVQAENNTLKEQGEKDAQAIQDLTKQVEDLTAERDTLSEENGKLTEENGKLTETMDGMNRNLTASQQKMQGILYIMTDGAQGSIDSVLSPYVKIYADVGVDSPYFDAVDYVTGKELMEARGEETFGAAEPATLGEMADGLYRIQGRTGTQEEAVAALLETEKAWIAAQTPAEETPAAEEAITEEAAGEPAAEEAPAAEETAVETPVEEAPAEEGAAKETAGEAAAEAPAEETQTEEAVTEETAEEPAAEEAPAAEETAAEAPAAEEAPAEEVVTEETAEEPAAEKVPAEEAPAEEAAAEEAAEEPVAEEAPAEETATEETAEEPAAAEAPAEETPAEDGTTILTRERMMALCQAFCGAEKEAPAIAFPDAEAAEATRGDLAMVLQALDQLK